MSLIYPFSFIGGAKTLGLKSYVFSFSNVNMPSGVSPGDLIIHIQSGISDSGLSGSSAPSGYTRIFNFDAVPDSRAIISAKVATSNETGTQLRTIEQTTYDTNAIFVFERNQQTSSFTYGGIVYEAAVETFNSSVNPPIALSQSIVIGFVFSRHQCNLSASPAAVLNTAPQRSVATVNIFNSTPQNVSLTGSSNLNGHVIGFYISPN